MKFQFWKRYKTKKEAQDAKKGLPDYKEGKVVPVKDKDYPYQLHVREKKK